MGLPPTTKGLRVNNEFDIIEHPLAVLWMANFMKNEPLGFVTIINPNLEMFSKMWGEPQTAPGGNKVWRREQMGVNFYVYTNEHSTVYKIQYMGTKDLFKQDKKIGNFITLFLSKLIEEIKKD